MPTCSQSTTANPTCVRTASVGLGGVNLDWKIKAVGDMNRDNKPDILWQLDMAPGTIVLWHMDGMIRQCTSYLSPAANHTQPDLNWKIVGPR